MFCLAPSLVLAAEMVDHQYYKYLQYKLKLEMGYRKDSAELRLKSQTQTYLSDKPAAKGQTSYLLPGSL